VLRLAGLDQVKSAVLNSLTSADGQRGYRHAIAGGLDHGALAMLTVVNLAIGGLVAAFRGGAEQKGRNSWALLPMPEPYGIVWIAVRHCRRRVAAIAACASLDNAVAGAGLYPLRAVL